MIAAIAIGALTTAILVANNLRDIPTDTEAGKHTLAVRIGDRGARVLFVVLILVGFAGLPVLTWTSTPWALLGLMSIPWAIGPIRIVAGGAIGRDLVPALSGTGVLVAVYSVSLSLGLIIGLVLSS